MQDRKKHNTLRFKTKFVPAIGEPIKKRISGAVYNVINVANHIKNNIKDVINEN